VSVLRQFSPARLAHPAAPVCPSDTTEGTIVDASTTTSGCPEPPQRLHADEVLFFPYYAETIPCGVAAARRRLDALLNQGGRLQEERAGG